MPNTRLMAVKLISETVCDICQAEANESFVLNSYRVDVCQGHYRDIEKFLGIGTKVSAARASGVARRPSSGQNSVIRAWAQDKGYKVGDRGRIPQNVIDDFTKANEA